jgi:hypothetical protein
MDLQMNSFTSGSRSVTVLCFVLSCVMIPFSAYHYYLVFSNQTTLEHAIHCAGNADCLFGLSSSSSSRCSTTELVAMQNGATIDDHAAVCETPNSFVAMSQCLRGVCQSRQDSAINRTLKALKTFEQQNKNPT